MKDNHLNFEEEFHEGDRKAGRKERKRAQLADRSKYKKTDQKKKQEVLVEGQRGRVLAIFAEGIIVDDGSKSYLCSLRGRLKKERTIQKNLIIVGDWVRFIPVGDEGAITYVEERSSILARADNLSRKKRQLIAVNIDQVFITCSVVSPPLKPFLIDRYIIAALKGKMQPVIVINKIDLLKDNEEEKILFEKVIETYRLLEIPVIMVSAETEEGLSEIKEYMHHKASVFSGQSGVGKSSLINKLLGSELRVGEVVSKTLKGSHTTTTAHLLPLKEGGFCIDTPGIKSFGIWQLEREDLRLYFQELDKISSECHYPNCTHLHEPLCAVIKSLETHKISPLRYSSYCALMEELNQEHRKR